MEGFINAMNGGWYHTAKVHKKLGFDISKFCKPKSEVESALVLYIGLPSGIDG